MGQFSMKICASTGSLPSDNQHFMLILIAVVDGISKLMNLGRPKLIVCILILAPVLIHAFRIEGMPMDKRGPPLLFGLLMAIPTAVLLALVLSSDGLFS